MKTFSLRFQLEKKMMAIYNDTFESINRPRLTIIRYIILIFTFKNANKRSNEIIEFWAYPNDFSI